MTVHPPRNEARQAERRERGRAGRAARAEHPHDVRAHQRQRAYVLASLLALPDADDARRRPDRRDA